MHAFLLLSSIKVGRGVCVCSLFCGFPKDHNFSSLF